MRPRLIRSRPLPEPQPAALRSPIGAAALENAARAVWQSQHSRNGHLAPLPLTEAQAWAEALAMRPDLTYQESP